MPVDPPHDRRSARPSWARRATTGSTATTLAALTALGTMGSAHAQPVAAPHTGPATAVHAQTPGRITVAPGDTVWGLATAHGVSVSDLMTVNHIPAHAMLHPGDRLSIPGRDDHDDAAAEPARAPAAQGPATRYTVRSGDTVWAVATEHGVSVLEFQKANDLTALSILRPGQTLTIPGPTAAPEAHEPAPATSAPEAALAPEPAAPRPAVGDNFAGRTYPKDVVDSANSHYHELQKRDLPASATIQAMVRETALSMGVDPALAQAHAYQESGFQQGVVSPADAVGTMQVIPAAGEWASALVGRDLDLLDTQDNITAGLAIIRELQDKAPSKDMGIGAYYQGLHGVKTYGLYPDTKDYVRAVTAQEKRFAS